MEKASLIFFIALVIGCASLPSCKLSRDVSKSSSDSTNVKRQQEVYSKIDTSKYTKETEADRVTYIYPVDTTINNYYTYPQTVVYEKVKEKEDKQVFDFEGFRKELLDSVSKKEQVKEVESKTKVGPSFIEWILIGVVAFLFASKFLTIKRLV